MIELENVSKTYRMGTISVHALKEVTLKIEPGEFIAIMGPSGSGKSTLMHVLGLLDSPDSGSYKIMGQEVAGLDEDEMSRLRRQNLGFIFQQFHLLARTSAVDNVAMPLMYSTGNLDPSYPLALLQKVGLSDRALHKPSELSGGQQQRVAIARALVNQPSVILADEPTGNLDSESEREILQLLLDLNRQGITIIMVTHEEEIGRKARRIIRMRDGKLMSDERVNSPTIPTQPQNITQSPSEPPPSSLLFRDLVLYLSQALQSLASNKIRTGLSVLGIMVGVAAVIAMLALGRGAQMAIEAELASLGSNLLVLKPGALKNKNVTQEAGVGTRLTLADAISIVQTLPSVKRASPTLDSRVQVTYKNKNWSPRVLGTMPDYEKMRAYSPQIGRYFSQDENRQRARVALLGVTVLKELFGDAPALGEIIKINKISFKVIGILPEKGGGMGHMDQDDTVIVPLLTAMYRLLGRNYVDAIEIEVNSLQEIKSTEESILTLMRKRHRIPDSQRANFKIRNMADIQTALSESGQTMTILLASIAAISLLVGGIGIMNIMLVSVTERTKEIGLRKAVGARRSDILAQFLIESVVVAFIGGVSGILLGRIITIVMSQAAGWATSISPWSVTMAFLFSGAVGMIFGIWPAKRASRLSPIEALRSE